MLAGDTRIAYALLFGSSARGTGHEGNLIAHQYGVLNLDRVFAIASRELDDLLAFCRQLAQRADAGGRAG